MKENNMKEKAVLPLLLSMAIPMMLSMLVNSLYNIVDSIFVARISEDAMTALSLVYPVQNFVNSIAIGFGIGANAVIALCLGAGRKKDADAAASQTLFLSIIHGIILTIGGMILLPNFLCFFTDDPHVLDMGKDYGIITLCFSTIITAAISFEKIFQSVGKMVQTMLAMLSGCIVNIILDPIMIFGLGPIPAMGIKGAAWATGIGQVVTLLIYLILYSKTPLPVKLHLDKWKPQKNLCSRIYAIGIPATMNMALPSFLISALNGMLASFGQTYVVVLGIYYKLQTFLYLPANGIVQGMRPIISYNFGAGEHGRVRKIYKMALVLAASIMTVGMVVCLLLPEHLIMMFSTLEDTIKIGSNAMRIISFGFIFSSVSVISAGALEALGKGTSSFIISLLRYLVVIVPVTFVLSELVGVDGVWHAFWIAEVITSVVAYRIYKR